MLYKDHTGLYTDATNGKMILLTLTPITTRNNHVIVMEAARTT